MANLKKIQVAQLRLGMYVHKFVGSWLDHPFWRSSFLLDSAADLQAIRASAVREAMIDVDKGVDVAPDPAPAPAPVDTAAPAAEPASAPAPAPRGTRPTATGEEMQSAAAILRRANAAVASLFQEARLGRAIDSAVAREVAADITGSVLRNGGALISLARLKTTDDYTYMHSVAVCALMVSVGRQLGLDDAQVRQAGLAGLLHDIGKMDVDQDILNKPGRLTEHEFELVKRHPREGQRRLLKAGVADRMALDVCLHHHERPDGRGYPEGLRGDGVSLFARMGAVCDVYDAITSNRPYKAGWDPAESIKRMAEWVGGHLDNRVFQAFVRGLGIYPIGSLVRLSSGRLAVVVEQSPDTLLKPVVKTVYSTRHSEPLVPTRIDLSRPGCTDAIVGREDPAQWAIPHLNDIWQSG